MEFSDQSQIITAYIYDFISTEMLSVIFVFEIAAGIVGNLICIVVFIQKSMQKTLTFKLLLSLSIFDMLILFMCAFKNVIDYMPLSSKLIDRSVVACKLDTFLSFFLMQSRNTMFMSITLDRTLTISPFKAKQSSPHHNSSKSNSQYKIDKPQQKLVVISKQKSVHGITTQTVLSFSLDRVSSIKSKSNGLVYICKTKKSSAWAPKLVKNFKKVMATTLTLIFLVNIHFLFFMNVDDSTSDLDARPFLTYLNETYVNENELYQNTYSTCGPNKNTLYRHFLRGWFWLDLSFFFVIPLLTMIVSFIVVCCKLRKRNAKYRSYLFNKDYASNYSIYLKKIKKNKSILRKLFVVNIYFFLSVFPYCAYNLLNYFVPRNLNSKGFLDNLVNTLLYSNNAMNFFLYGITSQKFCEELQLLRKRGSTTLMNLFHWSASNKRFGTGNMESNEITLNEKSISKKFD